jgi:hypothetical protein
MMASPDQPEEEVYDASVVDEAQDESIADDDSFDAYGEDDDAAGQDQQMQIATGNDDYAKTFDSPMRTRTEATEPDPDAANPQSASDASESMKNSSVSDPLKSQSPVAPPATSSSLEARLPSNPAVDKEAATDPLQAKSPSIPADDENDVGVDIQKLVDDITARAKTTNIPSPTTPLPPTPSSASLGTSQPSSLPPKPSLPQLPSQPSVHSLPSTARAFHSRTPSSHDTPPAPGTTSYSAPGTSGDAMSSLPPPPASFTASRPFAPLPNIPPVPTGARSARDDLQGIQNWDEFQADEKRYLTEAKWEKFPDGSRIFIGKFLPTSMGQSHI